MATQVSDLLLSADKLAQFANISVTLAGPVPPDIEKEYTNAWNELQSIARGDRPNLPKLADPNQAIIAGGYGGDCKVHGRLGRHHH
jgi:hypothetical protein